MLHFVDSHRSLSRGPEILLAFKPYNQELGTAGLSEILGLQKSTVDRLLRALVAYVFVHRNLHHQGIRLVKQIKELNWNSKITCIMRAADVQVWTENLGKDGDYTIRIKKADVQS